MGDKIPLFVSPGMVFPHSLPGASPVSPALPQWLPQWGWHWALTQAPWLALGPCPWAPTEREPLPPYRGAPDVSPPLRCAGPILHRDQQAGDQLCTGELAPQLAHPPGRGCLGAPTSATTPQGSAPTLFLPNLA